MGVGPVSCLQSPLMCVWPTNMTGYDTGRKILMFQIHWRVAYISKILCVCVCFNFFTLCCCFSSAGDAVFYFKSSSQFVSAFMTWYHFLRWTVTVQRKLECGSRQCPPVSLTPGSGLWPNIKWHEWLFSTSEREKVNPDCCRCELCKLEVLKERESVWERERERERGGRGCQEYAVSKDMFFFSSVSFQGL